MEQLTDFGFGKNLLCPRIVIFKDYDGKIKRGYANSWWQAYSLYHTLIDPGILIPTRNGGLTVIPGPRMTILYMFKITKRS